MAFASIFVPDFKVQAVVRAEPKLRDCALALVEGAPPLCNVVALNERAMRMSVQLGMTKTNAEQFAGLEIRARSEALEKSAHAALMDAGWSVSPRIEDAGEDEIVVDLAGLGMLFGGEEEIGVELKRRAFECGLQVNVAIAGNIDAASIAARGCGGTTVIARGEEAERLRDLPVNVLRPREEMAETLRRWGVHTCGALAALPVAQLSERLGQEGVRLHALARGASVRSLHVATTADFFEEEMELDDAVEELDPLSFLLGRLLDQLCARLGARALAAASIRTRFELQPHFEKACDRRKEVVREKNPPGEYETELRLPAPTRDAKILLKLLRLRLQAHPPGAPIQKIAMIAEVARPRATQGGLFLPSFPDPEKLELTIARIANAVGEGNVGSPEIVDTHRPGAFRMRRFAAAEGAGDSKMRADGAGQTSGRVAVTFRAFRPEISARVELHDGRPVALIFQGARGEVRAAAGPWRTSGDWWREGEWQQEEWDLEVRFHSKVFGCVAPDGARKVHGLSHGSRRGPGVVPPWRAFAEECKAPSVESASAADAASVYDERALYRVYYDARRQGWFVRGTYD
ncbi:MAG: DNA polymerase Y family protein [Candidatus Acidiferrales bacterium]